MEENDIPIDYITGTSMGAIVGGLYASGFTPAEMLELLASPGFAGWSTGQIDPNRLYYFQSEPQNPSMIKINFGKDSTRFTSVLPVSLINPIPMNMAFLDIFSRYTAQCGGDFDRLFVPLRTVTSDVYAKHKVVLSKGSLADAVRMSMSFPMVFEPIDLDGVPMYDGGIYDNFPVDVMVEDFNPSALVGVDVGSKNPSPDVRNPLSQLEEMISQPSDYPFPYDKGVKIRIDLDRFGLLDFGKYQEIYDITAKAMLAVGIQNGPAHVEMMLTESGPKLIEIGARLGGDFITTDLVPLSTGIDILAATIRLACGDKVDIEPKFNRASAIRYMKTGIGKIKSITGLEEASEINGVYRVSMQKNIGDMAEEICDSIDRVGYVIAQGESIEEASSICEKALKKIAVKVE